MAIPPVPMMRPPQPQPRYMRPTPYPTGHTGEAPSFWGGVHNFLKKPAVGNMLSDIGYGLMTQPNLSQAFAASAQRGAQMEPWRYEQEQDRRTEDMEAAMRDRYAKQLRQMGPDFEPLAEAVYAGGVKPADAWNQAMKFQAEAKTKAEQQALAQRNAGFLQDPNLRAMVEAGALEFPKAYEMERTGQKPPQIVEIFDEETGQPQKGYMQDGEFVPLGGTKAPSNGTSLTVNPDGTISYNQGGPAQPGMPYDPTRNPGHLGKKLSEADAKALEGYREAAIAADDLGATIDGLEMTIGNVGYTGPGGELYGTIDDVIGILPGDTGARGASKSLAMEAQLSMTAKTKGAITDREMGMFKQAVPGLGQTAEGNQQIVAAMRAMTNRVKTRAAFMEEFVNAKGSMNGAQAAWRAYIEQNPVLTQDATGRLQVMEEGDFTPYLPGGAGAGDPGAGGEIGEGTIIENDQGHRLVMQNGQWVPM